VGHELVHRISTIHKTLGNLSYAKAMYPHFLIQHIMSHHKKVGTPEDPTTARKDESIYSYYLRAIPAGYVETWNIESERLTKDKISAFSLQNKLILWNLLCLLYCVGLWAVFGGRILAFHLIQSIISVILFEAINYVEHYGLVRKKDANGHYESINARHSWNAIQMGTNYLYFKLQRHSDHHANAYKPYQILESIPDSPVLPSGYMVCVNLAFFSPIWKKVMNPYVDAVNKGEKLP
jgi:alkane 1-monooxygenase